MSSCLAPLRRNVLLEQSYLDLNGRRTYLICKRALDFFVSAVLLLVALPLMAAIALWVMLTSPGAPIYSQTRIGSRPKFVAGGVIWEIREFRFYKFRSMHLGSDEEPHRSYVRERIRSKTNKTGFKLANDQRVTRVGRWLRRTSLDELPQLFNVFKGEMSLVGPRPVPAYEVELYEDVEYRRLAAVPGMTGLWQVTARGERGFAEMVRLDVEYVKEASFLMDLKILLRTIPAVLSQRGAQ